MLVSSQSIWWRVGREHWSQLAALFALGVAVTVAHEVLDWQWLSLSSTPLTIVGAALGILLGFRSNEAYNRYNEARTLWGSLVNDSRTLARQALTLVQPGVGPEAAAFSDDLIRRQVAYVHALRCQLWKRDPFEDIACHLPAGEVERLRPERNVAVAILHRMGECIQQAWAQGWISEFHVSTLQVTLDSLTDAQGGCERIKSTPIPRSYTYVAHKIVIGYCCALPFGLVESMGRITPLVALLVAFTFLMLDRFAMLIEDPFCTTYSGLPLLAITRTIEVNLRQRLGDRDLPADVAPEDGVLR